MYNETVKKKTAALFDGLRKQVPNIVASSANRRDAGRCIAKIVASKTSAESKMLLNDMYAALTKKLLATPEFSETKRQNAFYELNLRSEIFEKYNFETGGRIDLDAAAVIIEDYRVKKTVSIGAGTVVVGGILVWALGPVKLVIPIAALIAVSVAAACASYCYNEPECSNKKFIEAVNGQLGELEKHLITWFGEVEKYFYARVDELKSTF